MPETKPTKRAIEECVYVVHPQGPPSLLLHRYFFSVLHTLFSFLFGLLTSIASV
jgi:hypothetical protein